MYRTPPVILEKLNRNFYTSGVLHIIIHEEVGELIPGVGRRDKDNSLITKRAYVGQRHSVFVLVLWGGVVQKLQHNGGIQLFL